MEGNRFIDKIDMAFSVLVAIIAFLSSLLVNKFWDLIYTYPGAAVIAMLIILIPISVLQFWHMINDNIEGRIVYWTTFWMALIYVLLAVPSAIISGLINEHFNISAYSIQWCLIIVPLLLLPYFFLWFISKYSMSFWNKRLRNRRYGHNLTSRTLFYKASIRGFLLTVLGLGVYILLVVVASIR